MTAIDVETTEPSDLPVRAAGTAESGDHGGSDRRPYRAGRLLPASRGPPDRTHRVRPALTHIGRWNLVERTPADIEDDVRAAVPPRCLEPSPDWTSPPMPLA
ncbi:hypothetical protein [Streptomyces sp. NPDC056169]|uniref:hypothetical protein n=1 Tax=Streptomyces sp. NPDC056169 TaxID=3345734 RepID=UPI0035D6351E